MVGASASVPLIAVHVVAASIWVGGLVAIFVVTRAASATLEPVQRVEFFRVLGRSYGIVGGIALVVAIFTGALLLSGRPWDGNMIAAAITAGALVLVTAIGIAQARAMTRLRRVAASTTDGALDGQVRRGAVTAGILRAGIGVLTLVLVVLGAGLIDY